MDDGLRDFHNGGYVGRVRSGSVGISLGPLSIALNSIRSLSGVEVDGGVPGRESRVFTGSGGIGRVIAA